MPGTVLSYTVRFLCPAFLGNADQSGQWRSPPFKALLRQWWRVAYAADHGFPAQTSAMRVAEGKLFGVAADAGNSSKSQVRLRLDRWDQGTLKSWEPLARVKHPEVGNGLPVGSDLYLGYGPLSYDKTKKATILKLNPVTHKSNAAIQAGAAAALRIALTSRVTKEECERIAKAIGLMHLYGAAGGRSRNGWGSFVLQPLDGTPAPSSLDASMLRSWRQALALGWPHAIGRDGLNGPPLIWQTEEVFPDWKSAMRRLAQIKIGLRTQFTFPAESPPHPRHWLSYPVTNRPVSAWDERQPPLRLPNSLRLRLRPVSTDLTSVRGIIFHVPCLPPSAFQPDRPAIQGVWERVHRFLDDKREQRLERIGA
jgi:CRISPR-associated protein Cmr1